MYENNYDFTSKVMITNIQRFSLHDGPGIRTTVFLKGCSLRCPWCCNPENIKPDIQKYIKDDTEKFYGTEMTLKELYDEIIKDKAFYAGNISEYNIRNAKDLENLPGGITFSGGEPLLQIKKMTPLLQKLKDDHIHMSIETSLYADEESLDAALEYIDLFYIDIKSLDKEFCKNILKGDLSRYISNIQTVFNSKKPVVIRIPVIGGYTDKQENRQAIIDFLKANKNANILRIELLKEHDLGKSKYISLGYDPPKYVGASDELMENYCEEIKKTGLEVEICHI